MQKYCIIIVVRSITLLKCNFVTKFPIIYGINVYIFFIYIFNCRIVSLESTFSCGQFTTCVMTHIICQIKKKNKNKKDGYGQT